ncbi:MAG TPA: tRNA dihydrouridine synthase DusB [Myxococcaceae bacterium]|nr:tRNA dihydrouridine synthase DusB [Myxococcaceae bacterium]
MSVVLGPFRLPNRFVLAPMAGVSEKPFRVLAFRMGAALCTTELVSAQGLIRSTARTLRYLRHDPEVERPYSLQIFGGEPELMAEAARVGQRWGAEIIDVNMGCPVKKVTRNGAGSALLCDPTRAADIIRAIHAATGLPVTAKIRSGWDAHHRNYLEMAERLEDAGCVALAVHPRTRAQGYAGDADWSVITDLVAHRHRMLIIGNGDVRTPAQARRMLESTGCDLVMIGRGALGNPWIFRELLGGSGPTRAERAEVVLGHLRAHVDFVGEPLGAVRSFRKHLGWYAHGLRGAAAFRAGVNQLAPLAEVEDAVRAFFGSAEGDAPGDGMELEVDYRAALG